ncbi:ABC transporter permease [Corynebacterium diphtheriae]|nr:ABC transporter permease [Corynebacterium diphtheriae]
MPHLSQRASSIIRLVLRAPVLLVAAAMTSFVIMDVLPGDAASTIARTTDPATVDAVRSRLGLDDPLLVRLGEWATALFLHGDGGHLYASGIPVWEAAASSARNSTYLVACALPLLLLIGILSGVFAGLRPTALRDHVLSTGAQITLATPDFAVTTVLLVLCAGVLHLAPAASLVPPGGTPLDRPDSLIVPALAIALVGGAWLQRLVRAAIVDAAALPHIRAAHLAGHHPVTVAWRLTLPAAAGPIVQACAATIPYAVTGTVVIENVVGFPGIGTLIATFIAARETIAVATLTAVFAAITIAAFTLADLHHDIQGRRA